MGNDDKADTFMDNEYNKEPAEPIGGWFNYYSPRTILGAYKTKEEAIANEGKGCIKQIYMEEKPQ